jgi:hypothetical protein
VNGYFFIQSGAEAKVDVYDQNAVKQLLDDTTAQYFLDQGYTEDTTLTNWKLVIGTLACTVALISHFAPVPFPDNISLLKVCCITYFILNSTLQLISHFYEKNAILFTKETTIQKEKKKKQKSKSGQEDNTIHLPGLVISTNMTKYDENYRVEVACRGTNIRESATYPFSKWFDDKGVLDKSSFLEDIKQLADKAISRKEE